MPTKPPQHHPASLQPGDTAEAFYEIDVMSIRQRDGHDEQLRCLTRKAHGVGLRLVLDTRRWQPDGQSSAADSFRADARGQAHFESAMREWFEYGIDGLRTNDSSRRVALQLRLNGTRSRVAMDPIGDNWTAPSLRAAISQRLTARLPGQNPLIWAMSSPPGETSACDLHAERRDRAALVLGFGLPGIPYFTGSDYHLLVDEPCVQPPWGGCPLCQISDGGLHVDSMAALYRETRVLRNTHPAFRSPELEWREDAPRQLPGVLSFDRGRGLRVVLNLSAEPVPAPGPVLLCSEPVIGGMLSPDACAWVMAK